MSRCIGLLLMTPVCLLAACDVQHGYETITLLNKAPEIACVTSALNQFGAVEHHYQSGGGMKTDRGLEILEIHWWSYGGDLRVDIYKTSADWEFHNGNVRLASPNEMDQLGKAVPIIGQANQILEEKCAIPLAKRPVNAL